ncbi:hexokinase-domain-containing protein [Lipomyces arxii]|uniref:hexokinase-domain-containing protein n=1 Tax=Lipomyces arxii TaxID=56418 RepID=UPI0034CD6ADF
MALEREVAAISSQFAVSDAELLAIAKEYIRLAELGLGTDSMPMTMIPSFVTDVPNGSERGTFLAVDLGGTNFRVCSVTLLGNGEYKLEQKSTAVSKNLMTGSSKDLFSFLAKQVETFMKLHLNDHFNEESSTNGEHILKLGFTFSFPVNQTAVNRGTLIRWTKGFDVVDAIGQDVCLLLQKELDALKLGVHVAALVNDTVGTLMSRAYASSSEALTKVGLIVGTGTNGAYVEDLAKVTKLDLSSAAFSNKHLMIVNTEWGAFDNALRVLPVTQYDRLVDGITPNPGFQMFEKRVSGMFLGEIVRQILLDLCTRKVLFAGPSAELTTEWQLDTSFLSEVENDESEDFDGICKLVEKSLALHTSHAERCAIKKIVEAVGKRSAYLAGAIIAGTLQHIGACSNRSSVDLGVDGSVYAHYPNYSKLLKESIKIILGDDEARVIIGRAEDGSGVGAALCALVA